MPLNHSDCCANCLVTRHRTAALGSLYQDVGVVSGLRWLGGSACVGRLQWSGCMHCSAAMQHCVLSTSAQPGMCGTRCLAAFADGLCLPLLPSSFLCGGLVTQALRQCVSTPYRSSLDLPACQGVCNATSFGGQPRPIHACFACQIPVTQQRHVCVSPNP